MIFNYFIVFVRTMPYIVLLSLLFTRVHGALNHKIEAIRHIYIHIYIKMMTEYNVSAGGESATTS